MTDKSPRAGRPKDEAASEAIKAAALALVRAEGYEQMTISDVIRAAGVSRQTLYNRWSTKADLVLDAFMETAWRDVPAPDLDDKTPRREMLAGFLRGIFGHLRRDGESLRSLIAAAQADPAFRDAFWTRFVAPRDRIVIAILDDAKARGELSEARDAEILSAMIHGAFWYHLLNARPLTDAFADALAWESFAEGA